ncbi:hypothetical protein [Mycobacterium haemophilum]
MNRHIRLSYSKPLTARVIQPWGATVSAGTHYRSNIPPIHVFMPYLRKNGYGWPPDMLASAHNLKV